MQLDVVVLGAGSGGVAFAKRAAGHGATVAVVECARLGGTCVNVGCVPKKIMWWASQMAEFGAHLKDYGYPTEFSVAQHSWAELKKRRDASVARLNGIYQKQLDSHGVHIYRGMARVTHRLENGFIGVEVHREGHEPELLQTRAVVIATGSQSSKLGVPGEDEHTVGSDGFFRLEQLPPKTAVIGAGYIAVELAGILGVLGSECHLFCRGDHVLRNFDEMISHDCTDHLKQVCQLHTSAEPERFEKRDDGKVAVVLKNGNSFDGFDCVIVAVGREPRADVFSASADAWDIDTSPKGHLRVDEFQCVLAKDGKPLEGLYALGDVIGKVELTPMAIAAGRKLADRLFLEGCEDWKVSYENVPTVVFSHPPIGVCGLSEKAAREKYGDDDVVVYTNTSVNMFYSLGDEKPKTLIKLVCHKSDEERVLGIHIIGMGADEIIQGFGLALKMRARKGDLDSVVAVHPSAAEEVVTCAPWGLPHPDAKQLKSRLSRTSTRD